MRPVSKLAVILGISLYGCIVDSDPIGYWPCSDDADCQSSYCCHPQVWTCFPRPDKCAETCGVCPPPACPACPEVTCGPVEPCPACLTCPACEECEVCEVCEVCDPCETLTCLTAADIRITITHPAKGDRFFPGQKIQLKADVTVPVGMTAFRFWMKGDRGDEAVCTLQTEPYSCDWSTWRMGEYKVWAKMRRDKKLTVESDRVPFQVGF